jgi:hypothetical protein
VSGPAVSGAAMAVAALESAVNTSSYPYLTADQRTVADIRDAMAARGVTDRGDQDAALKAASRAGLIDISSAIATYALTDREIARGIMLGGQVDHIVTPR